MWAFAPSLRDKEIVRQMSENSGQYVINENGTVKVDTTNPDAIQKITAQLKKFKDFDPSGK